MAVDSTPERSFSRLFKSSRAADATTGVIRKSDGQGIGRCGLSDAVIEKVETPGRLRKGWFFRARAPTGVQVVLLPELGYTFGCDH